MQQEVAYGPKLAFFRNQVIFVVLSFVYFAMSSLHILFGPLMFLLAPPNAVVGSRIDFNLI